MGVFRHWAQGAEIEFPIVIYSIWEVSGPGSQTQKFNFLSQFTAHAGLPTLAPRGRSLISYCSLQQMGIFWPGTQDREIHFVCSFTALGIFRHCPQGAEI